MHNQYQFPAVLSVRTQARIVNETLKARMDALLPALMHETGIDMWIIVCYEDNYDPVFNTLIPWECWAPILQMMVFFDRGEAGVERLNISLTDMQGLMTTIWNLQSAEDQWACLRRVVEERQPKRIGINQSDVIWAADGLTAALKEKLVATLGTELAGRIVSAEPLCIRWLETRLPTELALYEQACAIAHALMKTCFSRQVITPGVTTIDDLRWWYWQTTTDLGLPVSFPPFFRFMRSEAERQKWGSADRVIRPGDMVHCDVGVKYMRILTDHQELGYVLRPGEFAPPRGLLDGLAQANLLQTVFMSTWAEGLTGNEILTKALAHGREAGVAKPKIYSHSLSHYLHEPGPLMGLPWEQVACPGRGDVKMRYDTVYTVELGATCPVPEWGGQEVAFPLEQDAMFTRQGSFFIDGRQTEFHLI
ncbi:MAG: aminopeptidase P family protein [Anaerolineae bacterium]|nr:aminopeptidase P family protein [Anaerolineae bacterium]